VLSSGRAQLLIGSVLQGEEGAGVGARAALAMEDALVLAELLGTRADWDRVGLEYERRRRARVEHVVAATDRLSRMAGLPSLFRDAIVPLAGPRSYRAAYQPLRAPVVS
jgi:2-polyprenyl-6-methoxyphenol hydroxylase-like FAD-dependent oxidoreductase